MASVVVNKVSKNCHFLQLEVSFKLVSHQAGLHVTLQQ